MRKPSEVIELAMRTTYLQEDSTTSEYMCFAVDALYEKLMITKEEQRETVQVIMDGVTSVHQSCKALASALSLRMKGYQFMEDDEAEATRKQWFVWYVFDLKRKGQ